MQLRFVFDVANTEWVFFVNHQLHVTITRYTVERNVADRLEFSRLVFGNSASLNKEVQQARVVLAVKFGRSFNCGFLFWIGGKLRHQCVVLGLGFSGVFEVQLFPTHLVGTFTRLIHCKGFFCLGVVFKLTLAQRFGNVKHTHTLLAFISVGSTFRCLCFDKRNAAIGQELARIHAALLTKPKQPFSVQRFLRRNLTFCLAFLQCFRQRRKPINVLNTSGQT